MVYIPWQRYNISPEERKRLWDEHTAKQIEDAKIGIPLPKPPAHKDGARGGRDVGANETDSVTRPAPPALRPPSIPSPRGYDGNDSDRGHPVDPYRPERSPPPRFSLPPASLPPPSPRGHYGYDSNRRYPIDPYWPERSPPASMRAPGPPLSAREYYEYDSDRRYPVDPYRPERSPRWQASFPPASNRAPGPSPPPREYYGNDSDRRYPVDLYRLERSPLRAPRPPPSSREDYWYDSDRGYPVDPYRIERRPLRAPDPPLSPRGYDGYYSEDRSYPVDQYRLGRRSSPPPHVPRRHWPTGAENESSRLRGWDGPDRAPLSPIPSQHRAAQFDSGRDHPPEPFRTSRAPLSSPPPKSGAPLSLPPPTSNAVAQEGGRLPAVAPQDISQAGRQPPSQPPQVDSAAPRSNPAFVDLFIDEQALARGRGSVETQSQKVSNLDAALSTEKARGKTRFHPAGAANVEAMGKPSRIGDNTTVTRMAAGIWGARKDRQPKLINVEKKTSPVLSSNVPSANAITLWKRQDAPDDANTADSPEYERVGGYWERKREREAALAKEKVSKNTSEESKSVLQCQPNVRREAPSKAHLQTSSAKLLLSSQRAIYHPLKMGATKRMSNGEAKHIGPYPSTIRVSAPYTSQATLEKKLQPPPAVQFEAQERSIAEAREDSMRLQGCTWIDNVRRALQLPIRTYTTACVYYHKFRLTHPGNVSGMEYGNAWADACAASLLTSCKVEDTLKKSRDILAAAYNLKVTTHDQLGSDDQIFDAPSRAVIGLERLVLEAGGFDFRSKYPHRLLVKLAKPFPELDGERDKVSKAAWTILTDLHRTFAPLKQTSATMALASLELAAHLSATKSPNNVSAIRDELQGFDVQRWSTSREEIMETLLDALDLYTQHTANTILGTKYSLDDFLRIRLALNKECSESNLPRYTTAPPSDRSSNGNTLHVANGHPTPVSPAEAGVAAPGQQQNANGNQTLPEGGGTLRFLLNPQLAADEKSEVQRYFVEEWEEYEEEIEVPLPEPRPREREREGERQPNERPQDSSRGERSERDPRDDRERDRLRDREREIERERLRIRERQRDRDRRFDDRRYDERDRRFEDRRDRRYDDRRYEDDRRRRDDRR